MDKLKTVSVDLSKLNNVENNDVGKTFTHNKLVRPILVEMFSSSSVCIENKSE